MAIRWKIGIVDKQPNDLNVRWFSKPKDFAFEVLTLVFVQ